jgi:O-antigen biosynthesis protein WbqP
MFMRARVLKRAFDLCLAAPGLLVGFPVVVALIVAVRLDSPGPGIFRQVRVGQNGKQFICLKLRTMVAGTLDRPSHETGGDSITKLGHLLRRTKLDELPQLWNVMRGEMSFVGPRPCLPTQTELIELRRANGVLSLRPGITGIAQTRGVDMSEPGRLAAVDAEYVDVVSLRTDVALIWRTVIGAGRGDAARRRSRAGRD